MPLPQLLRVVILSSTQTSYPQPFYPRLPERNATPSAIAGCPFPDLLSLAARSQAPGPVRLRSSGLARIFLTLPVLYVPSSASRPVQCRLRVRQVAGNHLHGGNRRPRSSIDIDPAWLAVSVRVQRSFRCQCGLVTANCWRRPAARTYVQYITVHWCLSSADGRPVSSLYYV